jgi:hypothetical protein
MGTQATPTPKYPPDSGPACVVALADPTNETIEIVNIGFGTYPNPFFVDAKNVPLEMVGSDEVCTIAEALAQTAKITADTGITFKDLVPNMGAFNYTAWPGIALGTAMPFGTGPASVNLYNAIDAKTGVDYGNVRALIRAQNAHGVGAPGSKWIFAPIKDNSDQAPQLQLTWPG